MTIFQCVKNNCIIHEAATERDAIEWLENNGGGIYRNILHKFEYRVISRTIKEKDNEQCNGNHPKQSRWMGQKY